MLSSSAFRLLSLAGRVTGHVGPPVDRASFGARRRASRSGGTLRRLAFGGVRPGVRTHDVVTAGGTRLRVYTPVVPPGRVLGVVVHLHGGGFVLGGVDSAPWWCSSIAAATPAVVVSVDYRRAPEHPFPAGLDDCVAAVRWVARHPEHIGRLARVDVTRLALMGDSVGGSLAAATTLQLRDHAVAGDPWLVHQVLVYPATDATMSSPSVRSRTSAPFLTATDLARFYELYLHDLAGLPVVASTDPRVSPLLARSHAGLPPATVIVAELDPLRDDGRRYARALLDDDVPVRLTEYPGGVHGFAAVPGLDPVRSRHALAEVSAALREAAAHARAPRRPVWV